MNLRTLSPTQLREIVAIGNFEQLLDVLEDQQIEFKTTPYFLESDKGKHELAKDISGMLNAGGGLIVLGIKTRKDATAFADVADSVIPFERSLIDPDQVRKIWRSLIYPALPQIEISWHEGANSPGRGIVMISVPPPVSSDQPYLMIKALDDSDKLRGSLFGYFRRQTTDVDNLSAQQMHLWLREGARAGEIRSQYDSIVELLHRLDQDHTKQMQADRQSRGMRFASLRDDAVKAFAMTGGPLLFLASDAQQPTEINQIFRSEWSPVVQLVDAPKQIRHGGWDLNMDGRSEIVRGDLRRKAKPGYKVLQVSRDGNIIFISRADERFLCWGSKQRGEGVLAINPLALAEVVYNFVVFSEQVFNFADPTPSHVRYYLHMQRMQDEAGLATLRPERVGQYDHWSMIPRVAPNPYFATDTTQPVGASAGKIAFELVREVYIWFGIPVDQIPYALVDTNGGVIDQNTIWGSGAESERGTGFHQ
jgi:hypothetical protein